MGQVCAVANPRPVALHHKPFRVDIRNNVFTEKKVFKQAAQGSGRDPIPGGIQETCGWGTKGHGLVIGPGRSG